MVIKKIYKALVITALALILGFAGPVFSATPPKVGDLMKSVVPAGVVYDSSTDYSYACQSGTLDMKEYDLGGSPAVDEYMLGDRLVIVATLDSDGGLQALYGDKDGNGKITDIGTAFDPVFGSGPCDYLDNQVNQ